MYKLLENLRKRSYMKQSLPTQPIYMKIKHIFSSLTPYGTIRTICSQTDPKSGNLEGLFLHHNSPAHSSKNKMTVVPHAPCSPDLYPCDSLLFPELKTVLKRRRLMTSSSLKQNHRIHLLTFKQHTSQNVSNSGKNFGLT